MPYEVHHAQPLYALFSHVHVSRDRSIFLYLGYCHACQARKIELSPMSDQPTAKSGLAKQLKGDDCSILATSTILLALSLTGYATCRRIIRPRAPAIADAPDTF